MCGIIGLTSKANVSLAVLSTGLKQLEYRGYDSCGIAYVDDHQLNIRKSLGKIAELEKQLPMVATNCAIAHTRWATHGMPSLANAHPHHHGMVTLVHNGIIENSSKLKEELGDKQLYGQTDSEIICAYLDMLYARCHDHLQALKHLEQMIKGSYALAVIFGDALDSIYCVRKDNPLILGVAEESIYLASDVSAFIEHTDQVVYLAQGEIALLHADQLSIYDKNLQLSDYVIERSLVNKEDVRHQGFKTFMLKEIYEQPTVIARMLDMFCPDDLQQLKDNLLDISKYGQIVIVGCGSAYHAGLVGQILIENKLEIPVRTYLASEFRYANINLRADTLAIFISQSGETADTLAALRKCKMMNIDTLAIVNVIGSSLYNEAKYPLLTLANKEISVATTKAYSAQVLMLMLLIIRAGLMDDPTLHQELLALPKVIASFISLLDLHQLIAELKNKEHAYFIGRQIDHAICLEAALKLKEISYIHCEAYAAGELKHGSIALINENSVVFANIDEQAVADKTLSNLAEVAARKAKVFCISSLEDVAADIKIPRVKALLQPLVTITFYQLLAHEVALIRGCNVDQPRNLAKSVTVE